MSRISIDLTPEEHQRLKALAALQGKTIKQYVLARSLPQDAEADEALALRELEALLDERIKEADAEGPSEATVDEIFSEAKKEFRAENSA